MFAVSALTYWPFSTTAGTPVSLLLISRARMALLGVHVYVRSPFSTVIHCDEPVIAAPTPTPMKRVLVSRYCSAM